MSNMRWDPKGRWRLAAALLALAVAAAGCADEGAEAPGSGSELTELGQQLPERIKQSREIRVGSDIAYAPMEFYKEGTQEAQGVDVEIGQALGEKLGVKVTFMNIGFDSLIPSLQAQRIDAVMSSMTDTKERQEQVDFIDYFQAGSTILVPKGNPEGIQSLDDLCGKTVAVQRDTTNEEIARAQAEKCEAEGKGELKVEALPKDTDAVVRVKSGAAAADVTDYPVAIYTAQTSGGGNDFEVVGEQIDAAPYGIAVRKDDTQLRDALKAALEAIIADGTYDRILEKWNATGGALKTAAINGGQ